ncbi:MAG: helix-turn-helix domain-containing protein [Nanoarchaeota archaeon]|nr:helix-turn-helix domain-containing protein [Nanoarchaeota archaeon]
MDTSILKDLGLSQAEIKVYITLLELGESSAGKILKRSGLQNSVVHRALNSLIEKGIINYIYEGRIRIYLASEPDYFLNYIDDKKERFRQILPELRAKQDFTKDHEMASIYKGIRGIKEVYSILRTEKAKEYLSFGGGKQCEEKMGTMWWKNHHIKRIANKLPSRQVFDETVKVFGKDLTKKALSKVRYLSAEFSQFQETVIVGNLTAITIFTENAYSILIRDKSVTEGYKKYFEFLWKNAKS